MVSSHPRLWLHIGDLLEPTVTGETGARGGIPQQITIFTAWIRAAAFHTAEHKSGDLIAKQPVNLQE